jgi:hypothetical protein
MRIVHSFWSKPMLDDEGKKISNLSYNNWVNKKMFYYSHVLSFILINKYYKGKTTLVTDRFGKSLLVDTLKLEYDKVVVELDCLNFYPSKMWALGKIYTYSLFQEPFIHLDFDFLLSKPFEKSFVEADLVAYMDENDEIRQKGYSDFVNKYFINYSLSENTKKYFFDYQRIAYNAGVFGGSKYSLFKELWNLTEEIMNDNQGKIHTDLELNKESFSMTNVILEQYLFACLAEEKKIKVKCLHQNDNSAIDELKFRFLEGNLPKYKVQYFPGQHVHMVGHYKSNIDNAVLIENILKKTSPESFFLVNDLLEKHLI